MWEIERNDKATMHPQLVNGPVFRTVTIQNFLETDPFQYAGVFLRIIGELGLQHRPLLQSMLKSVPTAGYKLDIKLIGREQRIERFKGTAPIDILKEYLIKKEQRNVVDLLQLDEAITQQAART